MDEVERARDEKISDLSEFPLAIPRFTFIFTSALLDNCSLISSITVSITPDLPILTVIGRLGSEDCLIILLGILDVLITSERRSPGSYRIAP